MNQPLVFYYRDGCHLCEDMWHQLREIQEQRSFEIVLSDVDHDPGLIERFGTLIPVLASGEQIICNYYLDPIALEKYLDSLMPSG
ncbi:glutaredoxin family protein [Sedimenticola selenatireducens]|nr:glutaredoxin family protein [Sedimenticola selenatireducens]